MVALLKLTIDLEEPNAIRALCAKEALGCSWLSTCAANCADCHSVLCYCSGRVRRRKQSCNFESESAKRGCPGQLQTDRGSEHSSRPEHDAAGVHLLRILHRCRICG